MTAFHRYVALSDFLYFITQEGKAQGFTVHNGKRKSTCNSFALE